MDLIKTLLVYMSLVFSASVVTAPEPGTIPPAAIATPTPVVATATPSSTHAPVVTPRPGPTITPSPDYKILSVGSRGEEVKKLQRRLKELGYLTGTADGAYGNQTRRAVERFQYYNGLYVDGVAGPRTQTILYESYDVVYAPVDVTPTPTPTPTPAPRPTRTPRPTLTPTQAATSTPTQVPTNTPTPAPTDTPTQAPTNTPTPVPTDTPTPVPTDTPTPVPTDTPTPVPTDTPTPVPTDTPTPVPTDTPTPAPTDTPEPTPTPVPAPSPVADSLIRVNGEAALEDENGRPVRYSQDASGSVMVPFTTLVSRHGWESVPDAGNPDAYIVTANGYSLYITYGRDASGQVNLVEVQADGLPVEIMDGQAVVVGEELFLSPELLKGMMGADWRLEELTLILDFPPKDKDGFGTNII